MTELEELYTNTLVDRMPGCIQQVRLRNRVIDIVHPDIGAIEVKTPKDAARNLDAQIREMSIFERSYIAIDALDVRRFNRTLDRYSHLGVIHIVPGCAYHIAIEANTHSIVQLCRDTLMGAMHTHEYYELARRVVNGDVHGDKDIARMVPNNAFKAFSVCRALLDTIYDSELRAYWIECFKTRR